MTKRELLFLSLVLALSLVSIPSFAGRRGGGGFARQHPRRAEVNGRRMNQNRRINQGVRSGQLTHQETHQMRSEERGVRAQEHADVKANGGYLTRGEKRQLNHEENGMSRQIYRDKHNNQTR